MAESMETKTSLPVTATPAVQCFDNEKLFDTDGHLTDDGLQALADSRLDELGGLEAAEHLTFCDRCLARYTALLDAMQQSLQSPMHDLIPQVQSLMRLRSFRVMTNRYVSVAAAVVLAVALWSFGLFGGKPALGGAVQSAPQPAQPPKASISRVISGAFDSVGNGINNLFGNVQQTAQSGLAQLADPTQNLKSGVQSAADGE